MNVRMNITGALQERVACYGSPNVEDSELYSDLFIALTVLEKLEVSYSKSLITMTEYESELNTAVHQCNKCHTLVKSEVRPFLHCKNASQQVSPKTFSI